MHLSSWAPRAKIFPSGDWYAEKGGWSHLDGSTGTESRWELRRMEGREGSEPGHVRRRSGFDRANSRVLVWRPMERAWDLRNETAEA